MQKKKKKKKKKKINYFKTLMTIEVNPIHLFYLSFNRNRKRESFTLRLLRQFIDYLFIHLFVYLLYKIEQTFFFVLLIISLKK